MEIKQLIPAQEGGYLVALPKAEEAAFTLYPVVAWAWVRWSGGEQTIEPAIATRSGVGVAHDLAPWFFMLYPGEEWEEVREEALEAREDFHKRAARREED
jgi:hypothetical protein